MRIGRAPYKSSQPIATVIFRTLVRVKAECKGDLIELWHGFCDLQAPFRRKNAERSVTHEPYLSQRLPDRASSGCAFFWIHSLHSVQHGDVLRRPSNSFLLTPSIVTFFTLRLSHWSSPACALRDPGSSSLTLCALAEKAAKSQLQIP